MLGSRAAFFMGDGPGERRGDDVTMCAFSSIHFQRASESESSLKSRGASRFHRCDLRVDLPPPPRAGVGKGRQASGIILVM